MAHTTFKHVGLQSFQIKIIHRLLPGNEILYKWNIKNNNLCTLCNCMQIDDIQHDLIQCGMVQVFWQELFQWWSEISRTTKNVTYCTNFIWYTKWSSRSTVASTKFCVTTKQIFIHQEQRILCKWLKQFLKSKRQKDFDAKWFILCDSLINWCEGTVIPLMFALNPYKYTFTKPIQQTNFKTCI